MRMKEESVFARLRKRPEALSALCSSVGEARSDVELALKGTRERERRDERICVNAHMVLYRSRGDGSRRTRFEVRRNGGRF